MSTKKRPKTGNIVPTDDVRNMGGKDIVIKRMVNHFKSLADAKSKVDTKAPHPHVDAGKTKTMGKSKINHIKEYHNVLQTYKGVAAIKPVVDSNEPFTFKMGKHKITNKNNNYSAKEKFDDFEHIRRLNAMSQRILSLGKPHERKKNINDPISNPAYFFRKPGDDKAIRIISLEKFQEKLKDLNAKNKTLLGDMIYSTVSNQFPSNITVSKSLTRPHSANFNKSNINIGQNKNKNKNEKIIYTHIFTNPESILKQHLKQRKEITKQKDNELLNLSKSIDKLNKSNSYLTGTNTFQQTIKTTNNLTSHLNKFENKVVFPLVDPSNSNKKEDFQMKIVQFVVAKRIYKEKDLEMLLKQLIHKNRNWLNENEINEVFDHVKEILEN